jgi:hypothetical protein
MTKRRSPKSVSWRSAPETPRRFGTARLSERDCRRAIEQIKRSEVVSLLDKIEDENGPQAAHQVLAFATAAAKGLFPVPPSDAV